MSQRWTLQEAEALIDVMLRAQLTAQMVAMRAYADERPPETWDADDVAMLRTANRFVLDGAAVNRKGIGSGIQPQLELMQEKAKDGTLQPLELSNMVRLFTMQPQLGICLVSQLHQHPVVIGGQRLLDIEPFETSWLVEHQRYGWAA